MDPVIIKKRSRLQKTLGELRSLGALDPSALAADWKSQRVIERDLQVAIEVVIDICHRLLSLRGHFVEEILSAKDP